MTPVTIGLCSLYLGDSVTILPTLTGIDAVVTDPPYGIKQDRGMGSGGYGFGNGQKRTPREYTGSWDGQRPSPSHFKAMLSSSSICIIWGGNYFSDLLPQGNKWLVWNKEQTMPTYSDCELAWTNLVGNSVKMFTYSGNGLLAKETARVHPTQKPVALMAWCMEVAKVPTGATVLDPYCGSGSTAIACIRTGRRFVGCEIDPGYFAIACDRIRRELAQGCLPFEPTPAQARCEPELQL